MEVSQLEEVTLDVNSVPTYYGRTTDIPADEMTLSIDHIREQLFSLLTLEDLFNCRRLSRQWNSYATVELQERFEVKCVIKENNLEEYLDLLQKHHKIFPCLPLPIFRKYSFEKVTFNILGDPVLQKFLKTYGYFIHFLFLDQNWQCCSKKDPLPKEQEVMEQVRSLLIHSAPSLSSLRMRGMELREAWKKNISSNYSRPLRTTDPEFEEIHSIPDTEKNENLKFFSCNPITGKIFELAIQLAPNLEEIQVQSDEDDEHMYFIEPFNRLRFFKEMRFFSDSSEVFKQFADLGQQGNLKLRDILFMFGEEPDLDLRPSLRPTFVMSYDNDDVDAINKILACSWDSLETLRWRWVMEVPGFKWPKVMPNVWKIILGPKHYLLEDGLLAFPPDFVWSKTFPRLRHLEICRPIDRLGFRTLLDCFKSQCLDSVEEVHVFDRQSGKRDASTASENLEQLRRLFPSARVLSTWPSTPVVDSNSDGD